MDPILVTFLLSLIGLTHKYAEAFIPDQGLECAEVRVLNVPLFRRDNSASGSCFQSERDRG